MSGSNVHCNLFFYKFFPLLFVYTQPWLYTSCILLSCCSKYLLAFLCKFFLGAISIIFLKLSHIYSTLSFLSREFALSISLHTLSSNCFAIFVSFSLYVYFKIISCPFFFLCCFGPLFRQVILFFFPLYFTQS